jgi:hypothetical protein
MVGSANVPVGSFSTDFAPFGDVSYSLKANIGTAVIADIGTSGIL